MREGYAVQDEGWSSFELSPIGFVFCWCFCWVGVFGDVFFSFSRTHTHTHARTRLHVGLGFPCPLLHTAFLIVLGHTGWGKKHVRKDFTHLLTALEPSKAVSLFPSVLVRDFKDPKVLVKEVPTFRRLSQPPETRVPSSRKS